ncbi:MAG: CAP domain-containing protein [Candidatus Sericytochromatia bacterium]
MKKAFIFTFISTVIFSCSFQLDKPTNAKTETKVTNTNQDVSFLSQLEQETFKELNLLRKSPKKYAKKILDIKKYYNDKELKYPNEITIITEEGLKAVDECYEVLNSTPDLPEFNLSKGLSKAAKDLVNMQSVTTQIGHNGTDGSTPFDRMNRYGKWSITSAENIDYGNNIAERIIMSLLIDDGVSSRGHRKTMLSPEYKYVGVAEGTHKAYNYMFVMDFAGSYIDN